MAQECPSCRALRYSPPRDVRAASSGIVLRTLNYRLLLGSLIGTCREVLTTIELPSGQVRLMIVSRTRKNFSASMCVASLVGFAS